jgi:methylisocitrate lyase
MSAGKRFREALASESPLQIAGTVNAYCALLAEQAEFKAIYLSGAGVANASYGLPDLGITGLQDVLEDARRICSVSDLPLLVDIDTGWGGAFNIARAVRSLTDCGVAAVHIEDQVGQKRCGHRPNKEIVSRTEMVDRIKAAVDAKTDAAFMIMARTDALAVEGMDAMLDRLHAYVEAGADAIFAEAMTDIEMYEQITREISVPVLANLTEFGMTPLYTVEQLRDARIAMALYPLSAFRAMSAAALDVYRRIRQDGTQRGVVEKMQTREALYDVLGYHAFEQKLDVLFGKTTHEKGKM